MKRIALAVALLYAIAASAGLTQYECQTKEWWKPSVSSGRMEQQEIHPSSYGAKTFLAKPFLVDRKDGHVLGEFPFWPVRNPETTVLSPGSDKQSFVVIYAGTYAEGGRRVVTLTIDESEKQKVKRFIALDGTSVYSGLCE